MYSKSYKNSGVDTVKGQEFVQSISESVKSTYTNNVIDNYGGFSGFMDVSFLKNYEEPVLVSTTDGVGIKIQLCRKYNIHSFIGQDLVAMCSNDLLVSGAKPLSFLDYISCGKLDSEKMSIIINSIVHGCKQCGASLLGGETAEHPGIMEDDDYDLAGFMVGVVEKSKIIDGKNIKNRDIIIGLPSSGLHSNGFSLIREIYDYEKDAYFLKSLLCPTHIYERPVRHLLEAGFQINGMSHITGGGYHEKVSKILPEGFSSVFIFNRSDSPSIFTVIQQDGSLSDQEMFNTFNMGYGFILIVPFEQSYKILHFLKKYWQENYFTEYGEPKLIGKIEKTTSMDKVIIECLF